MAALDKGKSGPSERSDDYPNVVAVLNGLWRVIKRKGGAQWILKKSKAEGGRGRARRGVKYHLERDALTGACAQHCRPCDADAISCVETRPKHFASGIPGIH